MAGNHTIKAAAKNDDSVHAFTRSSAAKRANDEVRDLFRKAVGEIFGGESRIPESVKKAMVLSDYGKGRPLTARRILVVRAAIDAVRNSVDVAGGNKKITTAIRNIQLDKLPAEINDALEDVRAAMAARGGAGMPEDKTALLKLLSPIRVYVQARLDVVKQVDNLKGVSDAVRESLKFGVFVAKDVTGHRIAEYAPLAAKLDLAPLRAAVLRKPFSAEVVAPVLRQTMLALSKIGVEFCGRDKWIEMGVDGQQPYASIVLKCALSGDPELAKALADHADELHAKTIELVPPDEPGTVFMLTAATPAIHELAAQL